MTANDIRFDLFDRNRNTLLLAGRILLVVLFILFGFSDKLLNFSGTVDYFTAISLPLPVVAAIIAVIMELVAGIIILVGFWTRPVALLLAIYTLATAFIGHHYWTETGPEHMANMINFYKNISITGGFLVLAAVGPGRFSLDKK